VLLAATGLLDGRRATTHWALADELARRHPEVSIDADRIHVRDPVVYLHRAGGQRHNQETFLRAFHRVVGISPTVAPPASQRWGGLASLVIAATYVVGLVAMGAYLVPAGFTDAASDPAASLDFLLAHGTAPYAWYCLL
jgi:hypothetical protein